MLKCESLAATEIISIKYCESISEKIDCKYPCDTNITCPYPYSRFYLNRIYYFIILKKQLYINLSLKRLVYVIDKTSRDSLEVSLKE